MIKMRIFLVILFLLVPSYNDVEAVKDALDEAREFTQKGEYEKALERHVWFHDNILKIL